MGLGKTLTMISLVLKSKQEKENISNIKGLVFSICVLIGPCCIVFIICSHIFRNYCQWLCYLKSHVKLEKFIFDTHRLLIKAWNLNQAGPYLREIQIHEAVNMTDSFRPQTIHMIGSFISLAVLQLE